MALSPLTGGLILAKGRLNGQWDLLELLPEVVKTARHKLKQNGVKDSDIDFALEKVREETEERIDDPDRLVGMCLKRVRVVNAMVREGIGGRDGVAAMTGAASQIIDSQKGYQQKNPTRVDSLRDCIAPSQKR